MRCFVSCRGTRTGYRSTQILCIWVSACLGADSVLRKDGITDLQWNKYVLHPVDVVAPQRKVSLPMTNAVLHEAIYCQGAASNWAAHAVRQEEPFATAFDAIGATQAGRPVYFTGEAVFPWMLEVCCCGRRPCSPQHYSIDCRHAAAAGCPASGLTGLICVVSRCAGSDSAGAHQGGCGADCSQGRLGPAV